jgi:hypothetical protein
MRYWGILLTAGWLGSMPSLGLAQAPKDFDSQVTGGKLDQRDVIVRVPVADPLAGSPAASASAPMARACRRNCSTRRRARWWWLACPN